MRDLDTRPPVGRSHAARAVPTLRRVGLYLLGLGACIATPAQGQRTKAVSPTRSAIAAAHGAQTTPAVVLGAPARPRGAAEPAIRPFRYRASDAALADLRHRIAATKWPGRETVPDASQGVQLATMQKLARYWASEYDWRKFEARLNALPQFVTTSTASTSTSSTSAPSTRTPCRSSSRTAGPARSSRC
jgi:hypothetical protein